MRKPTAPLRPVKPVPTPSPKLSPPIPRFFTGYNWTNSPTGADDFTTDDLHQLLAQHGRHKSATISATNNVPYVVIVEIDQTEEERASDHEKALAFYEEKMTEYRRKADQYEVDVAAWKVWVSQQKLKLAQAKQKGRA